MSYLKSLLVCASALLLLENSAAAFVPRMTHDGTTAIRWFELQLEFHVATAQPQEIDLAEMPDVVTELFAQWSDAPCGNVPQVTFGGMVEAHEATSPGVSPPDNLIVFITSEDAWLALGQQPEVLATLVSTFDQQSGRLIDVDILVNDAFHTFTLSANPAPGEIDIRTVLLHEIGHFLGLDHSEDAAAVMHDGHTPGRDALSDDDVAGICAIYPEQAGTEPNPLGPCCATGEAGFGMAAGLLFLAGLVFRRRVAGLSRGPRGAPET